MKRSSLNRLARKARSPRGETGAAWTRLALLLLTLLALLLGQDRLGTAGAGCFARVTQGGAAAEGTP